MTLRQSNALQDLDPDIAVRVLHRGLERLKRIVSTFISDADGVLAADHESVGGGAEGGRHDVADVARGAGLEAFAEEPDLVPAGVSAKGSKPSLKAR